VADYTIISISLIGTKLAMLVGSLIKGFFMKNRWTFLVLLVVFAGCGNLEPKIDFKPPKYVEQMPSSEEEDINNLGSLYGGGDEPLFSDRKAVRVNDIVTVIITERASSSSKGSKTLEHSNSADLAPAKLNYDGSDKTLTEATKSINNTIGFGFKASGKSNFQGSGSADRSEQFNTIIAARIVKAMANGNYFIEGSKEILVNGEKQIVQISGVVRSYDIDTRNRISSNLIADARILYKTEGDIKGASSKGWGSKILGVIWPF